MLNFNVKYMPTSLNDVVFPNDVIEFQVKALARGKVNVNTLFYGPPGNGKTTCATIIPKVLGGNAGNILHINCSSQNSIDIVRNNISNFAGHAPIFGTSNKNFVILDEIDGFTIQALEALRGVMDKYKKLTIFFATTNNIDSLPHAIRDRFTELDFTQFDISRLEAYVANILKNEGVTTVSKEEITRVCKEADGSFRKLNNSLVWVVLANKHTSIP